MESPPPRGLCLNLVCTLGEAVEDEHKGRRHRISQVTFAGLILGATILLVGQLAVLRGRIWGGYRFEPAEVGRALPFSVFGWEDLPAAMGETRGCRLAVFCRIGCGACTTLAERFVSEAVESMRPGPPPLWLLWGDSVDVARWGSQRGLPPQTVLRLEAKRRYWWERPVVGDFWVSPTRLVLSEDLIVKDARPTDAIPNDAEVQSLCRGGGIAPGSLEEYVEWAQHGGSR